MIAGSPCGKVHLAAPVPHVDRRWASDHHC